MTTPAGKAMFQMMGASWREQNYATGNGDLDIDM
jgi:hypothetical protein